jgi:hypothetical protein
LPGRQAKRRREGRSGLDVGSFRTNSSNPIPDFLRDKFRAIVGTNELRRPTQDEQVGQGIHDIRRVEFPFHADHQRLSGELIHDVQGSIRPAVVGPILNKVIRPHVVRMLRL